MKFFSKKKFITILIYTVFIHFKADELQTKLTSIKQEIYNLYKNTLTKFSKNTLPEEEYNDHDYIETTESVVTKSITQSLEKNKVKKKAKKVTILEPPVKLQVS